MELFEAIITRRSIRKYTGKEIEKDKISEILEAAMYAPSAVNKRPWEFIVFDDQEKFEQIIEVHPNSSMLKGANKAILVCGNEEQAHSGYMFTDCAAATQNLLLAAHGLGLGACWCGIYPREERMKKLKELFQLPQHIHPFALISLGYPAESKRTPDRNETQKIHWDKW